MKSPFQYWNLRKKEMDLDALNAQFKTFIQKHQIVVSEMKNDPENRTLQEQLRNLQKEIININAKQKQITDELRKSMENKQNVCTTNTDLSSGNDSMFTQPQEVLLICSRQETNLSDKNTVQTSTPSTNIAHLLVPRTDCRNSVAAHNSPNGTVVQPSCATAVLTPKSAHGERLHPVIGVPSPAGHCNSDGAETGACSNLVPPIKVPRYLPLSVRPSNEVPVLKPNTPNNKINISQVATDARTISLLARKESSASSSQSVTKSAKPEPPSSEIDPKKMEFMTSLCLLARDSLTEFERKLKQRKRRSTANPQFSNAALEEKRKNAAQATSVPFKRPRGRPRLAVKLDTSPNSIQNANTCQANNAVLDLPTPNACDSAKVVSTMSKHSSPDEGKNVEKHVLVLSPVEEKNVEKHVLALSPDKGKNVEKHVLAPSPTEEKDVKKHMLALCVVCVQPGELVKCDSCARHWHKDCIQSFFKTPLPQDKKWHCIDCESRDRCLRISNLKTAKEEQKRILLKKSLDLRMKRSNLARRLQQLKDQATKVDSRQLELTKAVGEVETALETLRSVFYQVRQCS